MLRIELDNPSEGETVHDILWHNLSEADKYLDLNNFVAAASHYIKIYPEKNYQDLEKVLRQKNFNTHLYANKPKNIQGMKLSLMRDNDTTNYQYECIFSCRPKDFALKEVLSVWPSYEENLEKLAIAGCLIVDKEGHKLVTEDNDTKIFNSVDAENYDHVSNGRKKLVYIKVSASEYLDNLVKMCRSEFGKDPEEKIVGITKSGNPIFGIFLDDKLVDTYGFYVEKVGSDDIMKLFNLKQLL